LLNPYVSGSNEDGGAGDGVFNTRVGCGVRTPGGSAASPGVLELDAGMTGVSWVLGIGGARRGRFVGFSMGEQEPKLEMKDEYI